jgi:hypothetical protein
MESKRLSYFKEIIQRYRNVRGYMDEFIRLSCAPELLQLRVFPDAKEISESMGALDAVRRNCSFIFNEDDLVICVGDGSTPRTATLFALMTNMQIVSIDPALRDLDKYKYIKIYNVFQ